MPFTLYVALALVAVAAAQSASTTVSQSMPPSATASFNPGNVSSSDACEYFRLSNSCFELTTFFHSPLVPCRAQYLPRDLRRSCLGQFLRPGKPTRFSPTTLCLGLKKPTPASQSPTLLLSSIDHLCLTCGLELLHLLVHLLERDCAGCDCLSADTAILHMPSDLPAVHQQPSERC